MALMYGLGKKAVKRVAPGLVRSWHRLRIERAAWALRTATPTNRPLSLTQLRSMNAAYAPRPEYGYDPVSLEARGTARAAALKEKFHLVEGQILEVGCWDGMVLAALQSDWTKCTGIDFRDEGFDARAKQKGVKLIEMDATKIDFEDETFNFVFSFGTFEHLKDPAAVFSEIVRVTKPRGHIFLEFAGLYISPWGRHAYRSVRVPYCQFLFAQEDMNAFVKEEGLAPIDKLYLNGWRPTQFREIITNKKVDCVAYEESRDISVIGLINEYAPIFRNYTNNIEELITDGISAVFRRRSNSPGMFDFLITNLSVVTFQRVLAKFLPCVLISLAFLTGPTVSGEFPSPITPFAAAWHCGFWSLPRGLDPIPHKLRSFHAVSTAGAETIWRI